MQNKGFVRFFAISLALVCLFYLSFTFVTNYWDKQAKEIAQLLDDCDIAGYNSNKFDVPVLAEEFSRADIVFDWSKRKFVDVQVLYIARAVEHGDDVMPPVVVPSGDRVD